MRKRLFGLLLAAIFILGLSSCTNPPPSPDDVLTQKVIPEGKTPLTILVKSAFSINGFEKTAEAEFPEIDIVQVGNYSADMGLAEYEKRLQ
ncbi:MAG: multiple sugar-binding protein, partial [Oscillospiraceae bacterium]